MVARLLFNERSLQRMPGDRVAGDAALLEMFLRLLAVLRSSVVEADRRAVLCSIPTNLTASTLPGGRAFLAEFDRLKRRDSVLAQLGLSMLTTGPYLEDLEVVVAQVDGVACHGIGCALRVDGMAVSLDISPWRREMIDAIVGEGGSRQVVNAWRSEIGEIHRTELGRSVRVLPGYEDSGSHDPRTPKYQAGKSHIPEEALRLLNRSVPSGADLSTWWAYCSHRFFHRFAGSVQGGRMTVHWNGTTNPRATDVTPVEHVPADVREELVALGPTPRCGCREL
jgi:hypothetical protein